MDDYVHEGDAALKILQLQLDVDGDPLARGVAVQPGGRPDGLQVAVVVDAPALECPVVRRPGHLPLAILSPAFVEAGGVQDQPGGLAFVDLRGLDREAGVGRRGEEGEQQVHTEGYGAARRCVTGPKRASSRSEVCSGATGRSDY